MARPLRIEYRGAVYHVMARVAPVGERAAGDGALQQCGAGNPEDENPGRQQTEAGTVEAGNYRR